MPDDENIISRGEISAEPIPSDLIFSLQNNWTINSFKTHLRLDSAAEQWFLFINQL